jgi:hypothetical protein
MNSNIHPMDSRWELMAKAHYRKAYPDLLLLFRQLLHRAFLRNYWIPDPLALDYLTKVLIRFLPLNVSRENVEYALSLCETHPEEPESIIRSYENLGEVILWWSGLYRRPLFQAQGKRSFEIAYECLSDYEQSTLPAILLPGQTEESGSKRLKINKMFSAQFENFQQVLENSELIEDPAYVRFRTIFMTEDFCTN